jgi:lysophospholipase L1-like esterase
MPIRIRRVLALGAAALLVPLAAAGITAGTAARAGATPPGATSPSATSPGVTVPAAATATTSGYWTGTWGAAPESGGMSFSGQTIRQVVHTSISGTQARVQISNAFGTGPLTVSDVHIAASGAGSAITAGTDKALTFGGSATTTIAAGATGISDPAAFTVPALANVAISFYLPGATGASTYHQQGTQTNYIAAGDASGAASLPGAQTTSSYYFLSGLDVINAAAQGAVVTLGASITDGYASTQNANARWPNDLAGRLAAAGDTVGVINEGISGNRLLADGTGPSAISRFARDVLAQPGVRWVIFSDDPINDLGSTSPQPTAAQLIAGIQQLIAMAHGSGVAFICSTLTPYQGASYWNSSGETAREAVNAWIRGGGNGCDGVIDQDTATHDPASPTRYLPADDSGDHLHPNDAGYRAIANAVSLALVTTSSLPVISLRAHANGDYVTADNDGGSALIANRTAIGPWEQFDEISEGSGQVALRAHANGLIVTADNAGAAPLIANRTAVGGWETFQLVTNPDGSISLKAQADGDYVTAEDAGAQPLIANRTAIGSWEEFDLIRDS